MKLENISVEKIFGIFDHDIKLNVERGITIVIGENGLGKTKILEMVDFFFKGNIYQLTNIEFKKLIFKFDDDVYWEVYKNESKENELPLLVVKNVNLSDEISFEMDEFHPDRIRREAFNIARKTSYLRKIGPSTWENRYDGEVYNSIDIVNKFGVSNSNVLGNDLVRDLDLTHWFVDRFEKIKVSLIETQRVYNFDHSNREPIETVKKYSKELTELIKQKLTESTDLSSKLDRTYPNRLVEELKNSSSRNKSETDLNNELKDLEDKRSLLDTVGLVETDKNSDLLLIDEPDNVVKNVLMLYVKDSFAKLSIFDEIAEKIKLLLKIINERFKHKRLHVNKDEGFLFKSTVIKDEEENYKTIPIEQLSSGEKNELILFFNLIFNTSPNSLILIDEPEISLHISWQNKFITDLKEIHKLNKLDILIATHSPDIISNNWDLKVELKGVE